VLQGGRRRGAYQAAYESCTRRHPAELVGRNFDRRHQRRHHRRLAYANAVQLLRAFLGGHLCLFRYIGPPAKGLANALPFAFDLVRFATHRGYAAPVPRPARLLQGHASRRLSCRPFSVDAADKLPRHGAVSATLERLVDFDSAEAGECAFRVGAVNVLTGNLTYFYTSERRLGAKHFMVFRGLPPDAPAVESTAEPLLGLRRISNTPLPRFCPASHVTADISYRFGPPRAVSQRLWMCRPAEAHSIFDPDARITDHLMC